MRERYDLYSLRSDFNAITELNLNETNEKMLIKAIKAFPFLDTIFEAKPIA